MAGSSFDVSHEPAGGYDLEVRAWQEGDSTVLTRRGHWSIGWRPESWLRNPRDIENEVHFLLSADAEDAFARLNPGEQERYMEEFWKRRDPTPESARNEAREEFVRRIALANHNYGRGQLEPGMFTDMGRVFVRYGEPTEILHQVIPTGDNTLSEMVKELAMSEDRPMGDVAQKGPGADMRPFEVWIYQGDIPLPPDADPSLERCICAPLEAIQRAQVDGVTRVRAVAVAGDQPAEPVDPRLAGRRCETHRTIRVDRVEVGDRQLLEVVAGADTGPLRQEVLHVGRQPVPRVLHVGQRDELARGRQRRNARAAVHEAVPRVAVVVPESDVGPADGAQQDSQKTVWLAPIS